MKISYFALPLLTFLPVGAHAQAPKSKSTTTAPAKTTLSPDVVALLNRAIATYKAASGISLNIKSGAGSETISDSRVRFSRPDKLLIEQGTGKDTQNFLLAGKDMYSVSGSSYRKQTMPAGGSTDLGIMAAAGMASGTMLSAMLEGKNPVNRLQEIYSHEPFKDFQGRTVLLPARVVDGDTMSGVQSTFSFKLPMPGGNLMSMKNEVTAWFGGSPLMLRRVQSVYSQSGTNTALTEKLTDQQLNPTFDAGTFRFDATGLKLDTSNPKNPAEESYFDPRLKVGANPFAFEAKGLDGATITPAKYKGKVLLMDFWATWCGPCVASLPELKGAYYKYHAKGLEVVGISLDEDKQALTSFIKNKKMAWPQIYDGKGWKSQVPGIYGVKAIPFMLIIGKNGKIASVNPRGNIDAAVKAALAAK